MEVKKILFLSILGKKRWGENYEYLVDEWKDKRIRGCMEGTTSRLCRPLRILQFVSNFLQSEKKNNQKC